MIVFAKHHVIGAAFASHHGVVSAAQSAAANDIAGFENRQSRIEGGKPGHMGTVGPGGLNRLGMAIEEEGIVPIVEPEVLMDGDHDIDRCQAITEWVLKTVYEDLYYARVQLEGTVLKPNMVVPGKKCSKRASVDEVAEKTVRVLKNCVPGAVPGIAFLSGGQSDEEATAHLDAINRIGGLPWRLTFSYGRALQAAPQKAWSGKPENTAAAQRAFSHRARMNGLATLGQWKADLEKKAA